MASATPVRPTLLSRVSSTPGYFSFGTGASPKASSSAGTRLLWRGACEFSDGALLDGMAFVSHLLFPAPAPPPAAGATPPPPAAAPNPFAPPLPGQATPAVDADLGISLALESLRGRASVRFSGVVRVAGEGRDGWVEGNDGVRLYVDPTCPALYAFLKRRLLLSDKRQPDAHAVDCASGRSTQGLLISLGDESVDQAPLVIYALASDRPLDAGSAPSLSLHVGIYHAATRPLPDAPTAPALTAPGLPAPTGAASARPARPDDPAPRRVPELKDVLARGKKRRLEGPAESAGGGTHARGDALARSLSFGARRGTSADAGAQQAMDDPFSMPPPPLPVKRESTDEMELGSPALDEAVLETPPLTSGGDVTGSAKKKNPFEADNKTTIKRVAMQSLAERGLAKHTPAFKDVWNMVSRGALFAFRDEVGARVLGMRDILAVVEGHLDLYLRPASVAQAMR